MMSKKNMNVALVVIVLIALIMILKNKKNGGKHQVYGSKQCGYTVKQLEFFDSSGQEYDFIDCSKNKCPDFVDGFPTTKTASGKIVVGFNTDIN
jgi:hypothetical protein